MNYYWEYIAKLEETLGPHGHNKYYSSHITLGSLTYQTLLLSMYPFFLQLREDVFLAHQQRQEITDVLSAEDFSAYCSEHPDKLLESAQGLFLEGMEIQVSEDGEMMMQLPSDEGRIIGSIDSLMLDPQQQLFPFTHIGKTNVKVHGKYNPHVFNKVYVSSSPHIEFPALLGTNFLYQLDEFSFKLGPDGNACYGSMRLEKGK
ncbi:hypothetical protein COV16_05810 [Candidatus Woesearchaeota archaeon CG10_big_fil_rev_8_21_14_0_10_34_8]|nr:MAG: hypothetical protein COV16_05810 [Candidatus Woesearchaeota archaeon CG10_big_fil_rev_8_21_14_0_10_34_8]